MQVVLYVSVLGEFLYFFLQKVFTRKKSIKCNQVTFPQIFYAHKKHKKHKKQLLLTYFMCLKNIKSDFFS